MNYKRILVGGLVAGLVINASEFVLNGPVLGGALQAEVAAHQLVFASWAMVGYVIVGFAYGFALAWLYAALRASLGAGMGTGLVAGAVVWTLAYLLPSINLLAMGLGEAGTSTFGLLWGAVELAIAGVLAGWVYREAEPSVAGAAPAD